MQCEACISSFFLSYSSSPVRVVDIERKNIVLNGREENVWLNCHGNLQKKESEFICLLVILCEVVHV